MAYQTFVCITDGAWWHNALWKIGDTVDYDDKNTAKPLPKAHFVSMKNGDLGLMEFAKEEFGHELNQNLPTLEKVRMLAKLRQSKKNLKQQEVRIAQRTVAKEREERMDAFLEAGMKGKK